MKKVSLVKSIAIIMISIGIIVIYTSCIYSPIMLDKIDSIPSPTFIENRVNTSSYSIIEKEYNESISDIPSEEKLKTNSSSLLNKSVIYYTICKGDSLWKIAKHFNLTIKEITSYNNLDINKPIDVGLILMIPSKMNSKSFYTKKEIIDNDNKTLNLDIKENQPININENINIDSSFDIASVSSVLLHDKSLSNLNQTDKNSLFLSHIVKKGDSWNTISDMYGVSILDLKKVNPEIASLYYLNPETVIKIPEE